jgi:pyrimidine-nucleoside phosphorylase
MRMYDIIAKKRDGKALTKEEIRFFVQGYTAGDIPDYQVAALLMAIFLNKMDRRETVDLTEAVMHSGDTVDLSSIRGIKVDKHSTGGVGDKTTILLGPMVAACGIPVAKMSGRGLGHTGGTIDKLESITGFKVEFSSEDFIRQVNDVGLAVIGQSKNIAPADKLLYGLRDVTATVDNVSLIAASVMSKKLAAGSDAIVLDVKVGSGAFVKTVDAAVELGQIMVDIGEGMGREVIAVVTGMDQPLGYAVGNALEVKEAIATLRGEGPLDLRELCLRLGGMMVYLGGGAPTPEAGSEVVLDALRSGAALEKLRAFVVAQNGDVSQIDSPELLPGVKIIEPVHSTRDGHVVHIQSDDVGISATILGAGRETLDSVIDHGAGIVLVKKVGDAVKKGEVLAYLHCNTDQRLEEARERLLGAYLIQDEDVMAPKLIHAVVSKSGVVRY